MSAHTPGPWQVIGSTVYGNALRARLPHNGADARLIAAAPDLLEALRALTDAVVQNKLSSRPKVNRAVGSDGFIVNRVCSDLAVFQQHLVNIDALVWCQFVDAVDFRREQKRPSHVCFKAARAFDFWILYAGKRNHIISQLDPFHLNTGSRLILVDDITSEPVREIDRRAQSRDNDISFDAI